MNNRTYPVEEMSKWIKMCYPEKKISIHAAHIIDYVDRIHAAHIIDYVDRLPINKKLEVKVDTSKFIKQFEELAKKYPFLTH